MERVIKLIQFEKDRIVKAREAVEKASVFTDKYIKNGKENRLRFMGELYDSETILNRLEEQVNIIIKEEKVNVPVEEKEDKVEMFKELTLEDIIKGLGAVLQPVPTKKEKTKEEIEEERKREEIEYLMKRAIKTFKYPPRVFDKNYFNKKYCKVFCNVVIDDVLKETYGKVFEVERENPYEVVVYLDGRMVSIPKEYINFI